MERSLAAIGGRKNLLWFSGSFDMLALPKAYAVGQGLLFVESSSDSPNPEPGILVTADKRRPYYADGANE